ncbi:hypothetical protein [Lysinibacillus fusiformis]|uniref:hypothetical protein n=1 Tax=Lysinibacillus fusiformis TaxID=28031 RepID=UPI003D04C20B
MEWEQKCEGLACKVRGAENLYRFVEWNKPDKEYWYCEKHLAQAKSFDNETKQKFIKYYSDPATRAWLTDKQIELWEKVSKQKH